MEGWVDKQTDRQIRDGRPWRWGRKEREREFRHRSE